MDAHKARKAICEKVQVDATLGDRNLRIPQGGLCRTEIYNTLLQEFASSH